MKTKKKKNYTLLSFIITITVLIIIILIVYFTGEKIVCKQQQYQATETYYEVVSGSNCDYAMGCSCLHKSWWGLGACDSCNCEKTRTITKDKEVCIKLRRYQTPNYNENWLDYPEIYDKNGNRI